MRVVLVCDGAVRGNHDKDAGRTGAVGVVVKHEEGGAVVKYARLLRPRAGEPVTNNASEYLAVILGLRLASKIGGGRSAQVTALVDSELLTKQFSGEYKCRNSNLRQLLTLLKSLVPLVGSFTLRHVGRTETSEADALANRALDELSEGDGPIAEGIHADAARELDAEAAPLTEESLRMHDKGSAVVHPRGPRELRMFVCDVHGPFWKRVDADKPVARCLGVPGRNAKPCDGERLDPVPKSEERGEGVFQCHVCGFKWTDKLARHEVEQPCPAETASGDDECGTLVAPSRIRPMKSSRQRTMHYFASRRQNGREDGAPMGGGMAGGGGGGGSGGGGGGGSEARSTSSTNSDGFVPVGDPMGAAASNGGTGPAESRLPRARRTRHKCALCATGACRRAPAASLIHESTGSTISNASTLSSLRSALSAGYVSMDPRPPDGPLVRA